MFSLFRYKSDFFSNINTAANAKEMLMLQLQRLTAEEDKQEDHNQHEPPTRKPRWDQASSSLNCIFVEIANEQASAALTSAAAGFTAQLGTYPREAPLAREDIPLQHWEVCKVWFPSLAKITCRYLSAPCSSVESQRLFSSVSHIVNESRNRLITWSGRDDSVHQKNIWPSRSQKNT